MEEVIQLWYAVLQQRLATCGDQGRRRGLDGLRWKRIADAVSAVGDGKSAQQCKVCGSGAALQAGMQSGNQAGRQAPAIKPAQ